VPSMPAIVFPDTVRGVQAAPQPLTLVNQSPQPVVVSSLEILGDDSDAFHAFRMLPAVVDPGASLSVDVTFRPSRFGRCQARLVVASECAGGPVIVPLIGTATAERWNRAANAYLAADKAAQSSNATGEVDPGYGAYHAKMGASGYSVDESQRVYMD